MGENKRYYWLKLKQDFFNSRKMKKLRRVAGGAVYTIIYLKMQLISINNDGVIEYEGTDKDIVEQLALELDEEEDDIRLTLAFLTTNGLAEVNEDSDIALFEVPEAIGSETDSAGRMRRLRKGQKMLQSNAMASQSDGSASQCDTSVSKCDTEIDIEIRDRDKRESKSTSPSPSFVGEVVEKWNSLDSNIPRLKSLKAGTSRYSNLKARVNEYGEEAVIEAIENINHSRFLQGYVKARTVNFDWFVRPNNFLKVYEGNYNDEDFKQEQKEAELNREPTLEEINEALRGMGMEELEE